MPGIPMNWLITGGAGFLGINLVRYLLERGQNVRTLDIASFDYPEAGRVEHIKADIRDPGVVRRAMREVRVLVHCAAALPLCSRREIFATEVDGTRLLLRTAMAESVERFIHISSTAVYGVPDHHPIFESDPAYGVGPYGEAKIQAEAVCTEFRGKGLCVPVLRPKTFVGPERLGVFELLYDFAFEGRNFPVIGSGSNRYQLLDVADLCEAIYLCATLDKMRVNDDFNVGAEQFETIREDFQAVLDRAGHGKHIVGLPAAPAVFLLKMLELMRLSPLYQWIYDTMARDSFVSIDKIRQRLGFRPRYSNRQALIRNYDWYVANRESLSGKPGVTHRAPWKRGALRLARHFF